MWLGREWFFYILLTPEIQPGEFILDCKRESALEEKKNTPQYSREGRRGRILGRKKGKNRMLLLGEKINEQRHR